MPETTPIENQGPMKRKPILMPAAMISRVDKIAKTRNISFAQVVRNAVDSFDEEINPEEENLLEAMIDMAIQRMQEVMAKVDETIERLDESHATLEGHNGGQ